MMNTDSREKNIRLKLLMQSNSEHYYNNPLFKAINFTEGIISMVELCEAQWLLVDILAQLSSLRKGHDFITIKVLKNKDESSCTITFDDGNKNEIRKPLPYTYTDFPLSNWQNPEKKKGVLEPAITFFFQNGVLYLPSEH